MLLNFKTSAEGAQISPGMNSPAALSRCMPAARPFCPRSVQWLQQTRACLAVLGQAQGFARTTPNDSTALSRRRALPEFPDQLRGFLHRAGAELRAVLLHESGKLLLGHVRQQLVLPGQILRGLRHDPVEALERGAHA